MNFTQLDLCFSERIKDAYSDRVIPPELTLDRMRPHFAELGITRIADQTNLDRLGIPCFASFRPNSKTLSTNQGKGISADMAKASAVMEAVEFAVAERPVVVTEVWSIDQLVSQDKLYFSPNCFLPPDKNLDQSRTIHWCAGKTLWSERTTWVPLDLITLNGDAKELPSVCQTTNGLASGNSKTEALFHALCEVIERHANTIWLLRSDAARERSCFDPKLLNDPIIDGMVKRIQDSGMRVRFFNQTTDVDVPVIMTVIGERTPFDGYFEVAAGYGAHPSPVRAAIRAITEAAQTRITSIAAARDDITLGKHSDQMSENAKAILEIAPNSDAEISFPTSNERNVAALLISITKSVRKAQIAEPIVVELAEQLPCSVVRVLSSDLEDFEANTNWRIGKRAEAWIGK